MTEQKKEIIKKVLEQLGDKHGYVSSELLVKEAKAKRHPLHDLFEWEDADAAHRWRLEQAALLIRATKFVMLLPAFKKDPISLKLRVWVSEPGGEGRYKQRAVALRKADIRADFIERKLAVLLSWCDETADIDELINLRAVISKGLVQYGEDVKEQHSEAMAVSN